MTYNGKDTLFYNEAIKLLNASHEIFTTFKNKIKNPSQQSSNKQDIKLKSNENILTDKITGENEKMTNSPICVSNQKTDDNVTTPPTTTNPTTTTTNTTNTNITNTTPISSNKNLLSSNSILKDKLITSTPMLPPKTSPFSFPGI